MQKYELLLILPGTLDDKEVEARSQEIIGMVKEHAEDIAVESMGKNRLAYPIKQIRYGYYFAITFKAGAKEVKALENKLNLLRDVLRAIISHFNVQISAQQKLAYTQPQTVEAKEVIEVEVASAPKTVVTMEEKAAQAPESKVAKKADKQLDMDQINKKLDDLMAGDVISGV